MKKILFIILFVPSVAISQVITVLPTNQRVVALTFDACETKTPSYFDKSILNYLIKEKIPSTLFISGKFARRNKDDIIKLARYGFIEIENHSINHIEHMEKLPTTEIQTEIDDSILSSITGKKSHFFRFPAGNYNKQMLMIVEKKYRVVHWTFPSGDPDKKITPQKLTNWVLSKTKPGAILIFHINRRGHSTGEALPQIIKSLTVKGYKFVKLADYL